MNTYFVTFASLVSQQFKNKHHYLSFGVYLVVFVLSGFAVVSSNSESYPYPLPEPQYVETSQALMMDYSTAEDYAMAEPAMAKAMPAVAEMHIADQRLASPDSGRSVSYWHSVSVLVDDVIRTSEGLDSFVSQYEGFFENKSLSLDRNNQSGYFTIKVPTEKRMDLLNDIKSLGIVVSESQSGNDMTQSLNNTQSEQKRLEDSIQQFKSMIQAIESKHSNNTYAPIEFAATQQQLDELRSRLMQNQQLLDSYKQQVQYATFNVDISIPSENTIVPAGDAVSVFKKSLQALISKTQYALARGIEIVMLAPLFVIGGIMGVFFTRLLIAILSRLFRSYAKRTVAQATVSQ